MKRMIGVLLFLCTSILLAGAQQKPYDIFLGKWNLKDKTDSIEIVKRGDSYYIIEFIRIEHELYFSGDGKRAVFQEWGKGPPGDVCGLIVSEDKASLQHCSLSEFGEWKPSSYVFYRALKQ